MASCLLLSALSAPHEESDGDEFYALHTAQVCHAAAWRLQSKQFDSLGQEPSRVTPELLSDPHPPEPHHWTRGRGYPVFKSFFVAKLTLQISRGIPEMCHPEILPLLYGLWSYLCHFSNRVGIEDEFDPLNLSARVAPALAFIEQNESLKLATTDSVPPNTLDATALIFAQCSSPNSSVTFPACTPLSPSIVSSSWLSLFLSWVAFVWLIFCLSSGGGKGLTF